MNDNTNTNPFQDDPKLDGLLSEWHEQNRAQAEASRDAVMAAIRDRSREHAPVGRIDEASPNDTRGEPVTKPGVLARIGRTPALPLAACVALLVVVFAMMPRGGMQIATLTEESVPTTEIQLALASLPDGNLSNEELRSQDAPAPAVASWRLEEAEEQLTKLVAAQEEGLGSDSLVLSQAPLPLDQSALGRSPMADASPGARVVEACYLPDGGNLEARDAAGAAIGPCPLTHTDVDVAITGRFARVNLRQHFYNPFHEKIEAVYTFPMSQDSAVDRMVMRIGDRVIEGEVRERDRARQIYDAARARGNTASLLEQERANIFTQSVANILPTEELIVDISYVEMIDESDGVYAFDFPMTVGPRYIPGERQVVAAPGDAFAAGNPQVPDAARITPTPTRPDVRAGHDISISVSLDTGGPSILDFDSASHDVRVQAAIGHGRGVSKNRFVLEGKNTIPNKDFVLTWTQDAEAITPGVFTHTSESGEHFVTLVVDPPARVDDAQALPRELVFVLDTSGSMSGFPMEKSKAVMAGLLEEMRPTDTFNIITFAGTTRVLWPEPRAATPATIGEAQAFVETLAGGGGTEMMQAIETALVQPQAEGVKAITIDALANLPADGREVVVDMGWGNKALPLDGASPAMLYVETSAGVRVLVTPFELLAPEFPIHCPVGVSTYVTGTWSTIEGERRLVVESARMGSPVTPLRIVTFLTDGYVGNDQAIVGAIKDNLATTRVFSFGIGNSVNRYLLDSMAKAGLGEVSYVLLGEDADEKVEQFVDRISTPVLRDPALEFSGDLAITEIVSPELLSEPQVVSTPTTTRATLPDLFDVKPMIVHARRGGEGPGTVTLRGVTPAGFYEQTLDIPAIEENDNTHLPTLWARAKVEHVLNEDLRALQQGSFPADKREEVVELGETYSLVTQFTSFVAVDKARLTVGGEPRLVRVPVEMPEGVSFEGVFGDLDPETYAWCAEPVAEKERRRLGLPENELESLSVQMKALQSEMKYEDALVVADKILTIDPQHKDARLLQDVLRDVIFYRESEDLQRKRAEAYFEEFNEISGAAGTKVASESRKEEESSTQGAPGVRSNTGLRVEFPEGIGLDPQDRRQLVEEYITRTMPPSEHSNAEELLGAIHGKRLNISGLMQFREDVLASPDRGFESGYSLVDAVDTRDFGQPMDLGEYSQLGLATNQTESLYRYRYRGDLPGSKAGTSELGSSPSFAAHEQELPDGIININRASPEVLATLPLLAPDEPDSLAPSPADAEFDDSVVLGKQVDADVVEPDALDPLDAEIDRRAAIIRKLAPALIKLVADCETHPGSESGDAVVEVAILLGDTSDETLDALRLQGAALVGLSSEASVVMARLRVADLSKLAQLEVVLRVEPAD